MQRINYEPWTLCPVMACSSDVKVKVELRFIVIHVLMLLVCTAAESAKAVKSELNTERRILAMAAAQEPGKRGIFRARARASGPKAAVRDDEEAFGPFAMMCQHFQSRRIFNRVALLGGGIR